jgi:hypothetical protein
MMTDKSIYEKLADARAEFHSLKLEKTGFNPHGKFKYFELGDFLIPAMNCLREQRLVAFCSFNAEEASITCHDFDSDKCIVIMSPMVTGRYEKVIADKEGNQLGTFIADQGASLPGSHPIQNLGGVETYQRRYLWVSLMEIVEHDALDPTIGADDKPKGTTTATRKKVAKKIARKKVTSKPSPITPRAKREKEDAFTLREEDEVYDIRLDTEESAGDVVDLMVQFAMKSLDMPNLVDFWKRNKEVVSYLEENWPDEFDRLKEAFTDIKANLLEEEEDNDY